MTNFESDSSREWAAQAYALLKKKQESQKQEEIKQELQDKYGEVNINIQSGEYSEIPKEDLAKLKKAE